MKNAAEDVTQVTYVSEIVSAVSSTFAEIPLSSLSRFSKLVRMLPLAAELVILLSLFRIGKYLIGFVYLFKSGFRRFISGIDVRVVFASKPAISLLDLLVSGIAVYTEYRIVVFIRHTSPDSLS
jgi:hypothetical protein